MSGMRENRGIAFGKWQQNRVGRSEGGATSLWIYMPNEGGRKATARNVSTSLHLILYVGVSEADGIGRLWKAMLLTNSIETRY